MRDQIGAAARANNRTMTAEIVARLHWSFETGQNALPLDIPMTSGVEQRLSTLERDYVSRDEFMDFKLLVEAALKHK